MTWGAVAGAVIGAGVSYVGEKKKAKAAKKAASAASQPTYYEKTRTDEPWAPSRDIRIDLMNRAYGLLGPGGGGGGRKRGGAGDAAASGGEAASSAGKRKPRLGGGGGGGEPGYVPAQKRIQEILSGKYLEGNPHLEGAIEASQRGMEERYQRNVGGIDMAAEAVGRSRGGGGVQLERARAFNDYNTAAGDIETKMRFEDYNSRMQDLMQALGLGTHWDIAKMQNATARQGNRLQYEASTLGSRLSYRASMAGINLERQMLPFRQLGAVTDIVQTLSGQYGTTTESGKEQGTPVTAPYSDPLMAAFQGGYGGAMFGKNLQRTFQ